jgi:hypothetical protein
VEMAVRSGAVSQTQLAKGMNVDRSLLSKVLRGKKPWPQGWLDRAIEWLASNSGSQVKDDLSSKQDDNKFGAASVAE